MTDELDTTKPTKSTMRTAVFLYTSGADWETIAERCTFANPQAARAAVEKTLAEMVNPGDVEAVRNKALARLERLLMSQWNDAISPFVLDDKGMPTSKRNEYHAQANAAARGLISDMTRLLGANAPTQLQLYVPGAEEMLEVVSLVREQRLKEVAGEANIFDADVVEDDEETP